MFLVNELFPENEIQTRLSWALDNARDFAKENSIRPHTVQQAAYDNHIEYRYPPSWLLTPEHAFCFLGAAELIARTVTEAPGRRVPGGWARFVHRMFTDEAIALDGISLAKTFAVAKHHTDWNIDFVENWI